MASSFSSKIMCSVASLLMCSGNLQDDLKELAIIKDKLNVLREDVLQRPTGGHGPKMMPAWHVKIWLSDVEAKLDEVSKLITYGVEGYWSRICFGRRVEKIMSELMSLKNTAPLSEPTTQGLENKLEEVWKCLTADEVGVIGIWGMGGIGKTTLLTQLYSKCLSHFDYVIWLQAAQELVKLENFQNEIVKQIGLSDARQWKDTNFNDKAALVSQALQNKKVLVLLDDVWHRVELADIGLPQNNKCQIVFTTRSKLVCRLMEAQRSITVDPLGWEEAWQLFQDRVGFETLVAHPRICRTAKEIVRECQGLPLAVLTSAHAMSYKKTLQEWENSAEILRKHASTHVFTNLKSSYDRLPNHNLKSCLLYCALFPKDFHIWKQQLIDKWACEGFLDDGSDQGDPINKGYDIVETLVDLSLLEDKGDGVRMHDVTRDMCLWIACEVENEKEKYFVQAGTEWRKVPPMGEWRDARRISLMENETSLIQRLIEVPVSPCLSTLLLSYNYEMESIIDGFFRHMKALTVLDLSRTGLRVLPSEISELVSLQYLDVSCTRIEMLPRKLMKLEKLQCFNLQHTIELREIPRGLIASWKSLQVFRILGSRFILSRFSVEELGSLESLKDLSITVSDADIYHALLNNHKLSSCIHSLLVIDLERPYGEFLGTKPQSIYGICKTRCFDSLQAVNIYCCHYLQDLTWVMRAPNLKRLSVWYCENLEVISHEGMEESLNPFARLQTLILMGLPQLKSICSKPMLSPFLKTIRVCKCPMLKKLPLNTNSAKGRQFVIEGTADWWSKLRWEDDATLTAFKFCFRETVLFCRDGTSTSDDQGCRIQRRVECLMEKLERWAENKKNGTGTCADQDLRIQGGLYCLKDCLREKLERWEENKGMIEELLCDFSNKYLALTNRCDAENEDVEGGFVKDNEVQEVKVACC